MPLTTDPNDPRLGHGADDTPVPQNEVYLVLSDEERAKGFVRPVRRSYKHVGRPAPRYPLRDLTPFEMELYGREFVKFEVYPESKLPQTGRYWTQAELDAIGKGCGITTTMNQTIAETWARNIHFYGATYCTGCNRHLAVHEFVWDGTDERVGS